jgi:predicted ArsR family transcriptional regulator
MTDQFMEDYKRDTTHAMAARIKTLEEALREVLPILEENGYLPEAKRAREALK